MAEEEDVAVAVAVMGWVALKTQNAQFTNTVEKSHYPPGNHHANHFQKCPISRS